MGVPALIRGLFFGSCLLRKTTPRMNAQSLASLSSPPGHFHEHESVFHYLPSLKEKHKSSLEHTFIYSYSLICLFHFRTKLLEEVFTISISTSSFSVYSLICSNRPPALPLHQNGFYLTINNVYVANSSSDVPVLIFLQIPKVCEIGNYSLILEMLSVFCVFF